MCQAYVGLRWLSLLGLSLLTTAVMHGFQLTSYSSEFCKIIPKIQEIAFQGP